MKHNNHNANFTFCKAPVAFNKFTDKDMLQYCLGATLYMPGTMAITDKILHKQIPDMTSMVMCFEDSLPEQDLEAAESNVLYHLKTLADAIYAHTLTHDDIPLTFLRVRNHEQFKRFSTQLTPEQARVLSGFVFPKFYSENAPIYLEQLAGLNASLQTTLYGMPILEGQTIAYLESRIEELLLLKNTLQPYQDYILNIRVGGTDFSALFGVRRDINTSIYNIAVVRDCLSDILNLFNREEDGYTVSAPVWEYFLAYKQEDINNLLAEKEHHSLMRRNKIINDAVDGLLREVIMDKANGFVGKTVIHPSHLRFVNSMLAVTQEEYEDALQVLNTADGVVKSKKSNKMNEINPHRSWAKRVRHRANAYGVVENEEAHLQLILNGA